VRCADSHEGKGPRTPSIARARRDCSPAEQIDDMLGGRVEMVGQRLIGRGRKGAQLRERLLRRASSCRVPLGELIQPVSGTPCRSNSEEARPQITWACATYSSAAELMRCPALSATVADPEVFIDTGADVSLNEERRASTPCEQKQGDHRSPDEPCDARPHCAVLRPLRPANKRLDQPRLF